MYVHYRLIIHAATFLPGVYLFTGDQVLQGEQGSVGAEGELGCSSYEEYVEGICYVTVASRG